MLWHSGSFTFLISWLSVGPYTKSHYRRSFIRINGGVLWCSSKGILGPLLFLLYINDLPLSVSCSTELFADDRKIASEDDCVEFQDNLLYAASRCDLWKITLRKAQHVTKSKCPLVYQYVINENNLSAVDKHKHLGIWIISSLGWDSHINVTAGKTYIECWV